MTTQITCSRPVIGIILFLSLAANVFMGGMLAGKEKYGGSMNGQRIVKAIEAVKGLSPESRQKALAAVRQDWPAVKVQIDAVREKRDAVKKILAQKEYSEAELDQALAAVRAQVNDLMDAGQTLGKNALASVTPEERQKLIKMLPHPPAE